MHGVTNECRNTTANENSNYNTTDSATYITYRPTTKKKNFKKGIPVVSESAYDVKKKKTKKSSEKLNLNTKIRKKVSKDPASLNSSRLYTVDVEPKFLVKLSKHKSSIQNSPDKPKLKRVYKSIMKLSENEKINNGILESLEDFLRTNPRRVDIWLLYACLELPHHSLLPLKDKLLRRIHIIRKALQVVNEPKLVCFNLYHAALTEDSYKLYDVLQSLFSLTTSKTDNRACEFILPRFSCDPSVEYLQFYSDWINYSFDFFSIANVKKVLLEVQKLLVYIKSQNLSNKISPSNTSFASFSNPDWFQLIYGIPNSFIVCGSVLDSQYFEYLSALAHCSALFYVNSVSPDNTEILLQLQDYLGSNAPRIGQPFAFEMYVNLTKQLYNEKVANILNVISENAVQITNKITTQEPPDNLGFIKWFFQEQLSTYHHYLKMIFISSEKSEPVPSVALEAFMQMIVPVQSFQNLLHKIFHLLILNPIYISQYSSNHPLYLKVAAPWVSSLPLLEAAVEGIMKVNKVPNQFSSETPLNLSHVFGKDLSMSWAHEIHTIHTLLGQLKTLVKPYYDSIEKDYVQNSYSFCVKNNQQNDHVNKLYNHIQKEIFKQQIPSFLCSIYASLTMLLWIKNDINLVSSTIATLVYMGYNNLAKDLLLQYENEKSHWIAYATFTYAKNPSQKTFQNSRRVFVNVARSLNVFNDFTYIFCWIRLECLYIYQNKKAESSKYKYEDTYVAPSIVNLITAAVLNDFNLVSQLKFMPEDLWCKDYYVDRSKIEKALEIIEQAQLKLDHDIASSDNIFCPNNYFAVTFINILLSAALDRIEEAFLKTEIYILNICNDCDDLYKPIKDIHKPEQLEDYYDGKAENVQKHYEHDAEMTLDLLLLMIQSCYSWPIDLQKKIVFSILKKFPNHLRAYNFMSEIAQNISLSDFRLNLPKYDLLGIGVISDLATGSPSYYRNSNFFEDAAQRNFPAACLLHRYLTFLSIVHHLPFLFSNAIVTETLSTLNTTAERLRFKCPYSKRLWLHHLYTLAAINSDDEERLENRFLSELELAAAHDITFIQDPLEIVVDITCNP